MHKRAVLNLFATKEESRAAFDIASKLQTCIRFYLRDLYVETENTVEWFRNYTTYEDSRLGLLGHQFCEINLNLDLPDNVKNHFRSRIRCIHCNYKVGEH